MTAQKIDMYYVSDPICSHCWGLEPHLNKFLAQYGQYVRLHQLTGGILKSWEEFPGDKWNDIYKAEDTTAHWREYGKESGMPIDGSLMQEDPVWSSFPPSQVYKVLQEKNEETADRFLRKTREAVFIHNRNIAERDVLIDLVNEAGEEGTSVVEKALTPEYEEKVQQDRKYMRRPLGVKVTPAVVFVDEEDKKVRRVGNFTADQYKASLEKALKTDGLEPREANALSQWLKNQDLIFAKEIEVMYDLPEDEVTSYIKNELAEDAYEMVPFQETFYIKRAD